MEPLNDGSDSCNGSITGKSSFEKKSSRSHSIASITASKSISQCEKNFMPFSPSFYTINETDRLLWNQGLITPKRCTSSLCRQVRDKSYYKGLIYLKGKEIRDEIKKLQNEINLLHIEHSTYLPYRKKAESKAMELEKLHDTLANYNLVDDMLNRDVQTEEALEEMRKLKAENTRENAEVEKLFELKKQREVVIKELETDLEQEKYVSEILTTTVNPQLKEKYIKLKRLDDKLQSTWYEQEKELRELNDKQMVLDSQCNESRNSEAHKLLRKLKDLENQKDALFQEKTFHSVSEEKEYLQKDYMESSDLVRIILQEIRMLEYKIKEKLTELEGIENENSQLYSERYEKYSKLKKRETIIDDFLTTFNDQQLLLLTKQRQYECEITRLLKNISDMVNYFSPSLLDTEKNACENFTITNTESIETLRTEFIKLVSQENEIISFEKILNEEVKSVKDEISKLEKDLTIYLDTEALIDSLKRKETDLMHEMKQILQRKQAFKCVIDELEKYRNLLANKLNNNEAFLMLSEMEKKLRSLEEENYNLSNFITSSKHKANYMSLKRNVKVIYSELNELLKKDPKYQYIF